MKWLPDWITGYDSANADKAAAADAELRAMNDQAAANYGPEWKKKVDADYTSQEPVGQAAQRAAINKAFGEGWNDGKKNISNAVSGFFKVIGDGLSSVLFGIPAWVWLVAGLAVWGYIGFPGLKKLKGKFA